MIARYSAVVPVRGTRIFAVQVSRAAVCGRLAASVAARAPRENAILPVVRRAKLDTQVLAGVLRAQAAAAWERCEGRAAAGADARFPEWHQDRVRALTPTWKRETDA